MSAEQPAPIDARGPRFGAWITTLLLVVVILTGNPWLLVFQTAVFALGAFAGPKWHPYGQLYRNLVQPRLGPVQDWEDPRPPRFAQLVGFLVAGVGVLIWALTGAGSAILVAACIALIAAFLNAAFGFCLGCEIYPFVVRLRAGRGSATAS